MRECVPQKSTLELEKLITLLNFFGLLKKKLQM